MEDNNMIGFGFKFLPKGDMVFYYDEGAIKKEIHHHPVEIAEQYEQRIIGDLFDGKYFLDMVDSGCITNYDGSLGNVYIDNYYTTNLGLKHKDFSQGHFQVDKETWLNICYEYNVVVEWCNK